MFTGCQPREPQLHLQVTSAANGAAVMPGRQLVFPDDHGAHTDYGIEWWYFTANLVDDKGEPFWLQWTLFRYRQEDTRDTPWHNNQSYMAHASVHSMRQHAFEERFARGGVGNAGVTVRPYNAFLDDWQFISDTAESIFPGQLQFNINGQVAVKLHMTSDANLVLHGEQGYSLKYPNSQYASYYYSQPFINVNGSINWHGEVKPVSGNAWYDHEWSSQLLGDDFSGWDWFSLHLQDNQKLMLFTLKTENSELPDVWHGTYLDSNGLQHTLSDKQVRVTPVAQMQVKGKRFNKHWRITIAEHNLELEVQVLKEAQLNSWLFTYYEGAINVQGSHSGVGFVEMTMGE
ncbi:lipocalin-like domain-containing protein [Planctobacterium marinum]|uniref:Iron ABC transporter permease n=1 Tax=Planctobacterium marinum TaxID=1631968 RepID=A0AA48HYK9_9ALTE|nr:iron ABC transporter permease [Planctobacterium marinum]